MTETFHYQNGQLYVNEVSLAEIAAQVGTPCYVYSQDRALANLQRVQLAFPDAEIHYSLKANANLALVRVLAAAGAGFDAVSGGEIFRAIRAGVDPGQIVFAGVGKTEAELVYALDSAIGWFNVESAGELARLAALAQAKGKYARVALRLNPNVQADTHHYMATGHAAAKFGLPIEDVHRLLHDYTASPFVAIEAIHIHIGSQLGTVERTVEALKAVQPLFDTYPQLQALNIGGGFPVSYNGESVPPLEAFASVVKEYLEGRSIRLLMEPGRYIIADAGVLLIRVEYIKSAHHEVIAVTDTGMTELIRPALYGATHHVLPLREPETSERVHTHIVGPICESADVLRANIALPPLYPGDLLAMMHAGAYGAAMGSTYNARPRPPEVMVKNAEWRIVRRRENWNDLIAFEE